MTTTLKGFNAVVTGGALGIGLGIVEDFLKNGAQVMLADISAENIQHAERHLTDLNLTNFHTFSGDLSLEETSQKLLQSSLEKMGQVHILVNCAGGGVIKAFLDHSPETLKATIDRNLWTTLWCCRALIPEMKKKQYGRIINIGADSVRNGLVDHAAYNAAKGGVHGLTTGLAREFAHDKITVNTIAPSAVRTHALVVFEENAPELAKKFIDAIPLGRAGEISEIASAVTYIASPAAGFITGQVISVNGGSTML